MSKKLEENILAAAKFMEKQGLSKDFEFFANGSTLRDLGYLGLVDNLVYKVTNGEISIVEVEDDN